MEAGLGDVPVLGEEGWQDPGAPPTTRQEARPEAVGAVGDDGVVALAQQRQVQRGRHRGVGCGRQCERLWIIRYLLSTYLQILDAEVNQQCRNLLFSFCSLNFGILLLILIEMKHL